jgi:dTDP-4-dehydrorhamnose reductase
MAHRVLIVGPSSGLAEEFVLAAPAGWSFEGVGRRSAARAADRFEVVHVVEAQDIGPLEYAVRANDCDTVVSFLQEGDRARCQEDRPLPGELPGGRAWDVNVLANEAIGRAAASEHKRVIVVSTDEVFPETEGPAAESTPPLSWEENPSWFGGTWAEAETVLGRIEGSVAILRVSALFGWSMASECDQRLANELARERTNLPRQVQPTFVGDAVRAIRQLVEDPVAGVFHVALSEPVERREFAQRLRQATGDGVTAPMVVPERHPGLIVGRLAELGFHPTLLSEAMEAITDGARI